MPPSCAYRLLSEGKRLPAWHKLVSGDPDSVRAAGASVRGRTVSERVAGPLEHHIVGLAGPTTVPDCRHACGCAGVTTP